MHDSTAARFFSASQRKSGGGSIHTRAVTVGITGTTVIFESTRLGHSKLTVLEGGARLSLVKYPKESVFVRAGQMLDVPAGATKLPKPVNIDLDQLMKTSPLITDFPPLPSEGLIAAAIDDQRSSGPSGPPVYQGVAVNDPTVGYPGLPPPVLPGGPIIPRPPSWRWQTASQWSSADSWPARRTQRWKRTAA